MAARSGTTKTVKPCAPASSRLSGRAAIRTPISLAVGLLLVSIGRLPAQTPDRSASPLTLDSSDTKRIEAFSWAKRQAAAYAFEGDEVGAWFEAALPGREAFCMRDISHQALGGPRAGFAEKRA